jgi:hypothetical protein
MTTPDPNGQMTDAEFAALTVDPNPPTVVPPEADFLAKSRRGETLTGKQIGSITPGGVFTPAESAEEPGAGEQQQAEASGEPYTLNANVPMKELTPEREAFISEFAQIAPSVGLDAGTAQGLLDMVVDAATTLTYQPADEFTTPEDAFKAMTQTFGEEAATDLVNRAQKYVKSLGPKVADYLDRTGVGNDVGTIVTLALAGTGWLKLTPAQAQESIAKLMKTKEWAAGDKLTQIKLHTLSRIASRAATSPQQQPIRAAQKSEQFAQASADASAARAEAAKMLADSSGPLMNSGHKDHADAVAKWHALTAKL